MKFSLIMPTLGRKDGVELLLKSFVVQTYKLFELIIIDQNYDDRVYEIYQDYKNHIDIKYFRSVRKGLSYNRNIGLEKCGGDIIAFPDDDCEYNYDTLERVVRFFNNTAYNFYTCNTKEKASDKTIFNAENKSAEITIRNLMDTGISFTIFVRSENIKHFRFDEQLGLGAKFGSAEESDLLLYLLKNGSRGFYHAETFIYHPYKEDTIKKYYFYGRGYGALYKKAIFTYKFYSLFFFFFWNRIIKETLKLCVYPYEKGRFTSIKARLYGFIFYRTGRAHHDNKALIKTKPKVIINGEFFCNTLSGIERFAYEITRRLDKIAQKDEIGIIISKDAKNVPVFQNLKVINYEKNITSFPIWQQFILPGILRKMRAISLDFANTCSLFYPGISFLHDIYCELFSEDFKTKREKHERFYFRVLYRIIAYRAKKIATVSYFSKYQIAKAYHINPKRIAVIYSSWNHFAHIKSDYSVFDDFPVLSKPFYFTLGSLSKRKNLKWIIDYAKNHPDDLFAISGASLLTVKVEALDNTSLQNIVLLGYLEDSKVKALMEKCKAFIHPAYYEGFGLTPLEALSCGARIIISRAASLPEIYGNTAHYIDPFDTNVDLDGLLKQPVDPPDEILKKYSYDTSARQVYDLIQEYTN